MTTSSSLKQGINVQRRRGRYVARVQLPMAIDRHHLFVIACPLVAIACFLTDPSTSAVRKKPVLTAELFSVDGRGTILPWFVLSVSSCTVRLGSFVCSFVPFFFFLLSVVPFANFKARLPARCSRQRDPLPARFGVLAFRESSYCFISAGGGGTRRSPHSRFPPCRRNATQRGAIAKSGDGVSDVSLFVRRSRGCKTLQNLAKKIHTYIDGQNPHPLLPGSAHRNNTTGSPGQLVCSV